MMLYLTLVGVVLWWKKCKLLDDNDTWNLVQLHARKKVIGCCWVFVVKVNHDGSDARLKA